MRTTPENILIDCREFVRGKNTGIGRGLEGLIDALAQDLPTYKLCLLSQDVNAIPGRLKQHRSIRIKQIPGSFLKSEKVLSGFARKNHGLFISPYRKLPLFSGCCKTINTVHDILDITHPFYRNPFKSLFDMARLKIALKKADLTWYDSLWSMEEARKSIGFAGKNPRVRYLAIDDKFYLLKSDGKIDDALRKYDLKAGYILVLGNGLPHKNLGVILQSVKKILRPLVFAGVSQKNRAYWENLYPGVEAKWIPYVAEDDLPSVIKGAFCLAQPSTAEGYGYPPLEAMAAGIPAVISRIPVLLETTGGNAMSAETGVSSEWVDAFLKLENPDVYAMQVKKGLDWVRDFQGRKAWDKHIADIRELINEK